MDEFLKILRKLTKIPEDVRESTKIPEVLRELTKIPEIKIKVPINSKLHHKIKQITEP